MSPTFDDAGRRPSPDQGRPRSDPAADSEGMTAPAVVLHPLPASEGAPVPAGVLHPLPADDRTNPNARRPGASTDTVPGAPAPQVRARHGRSAARPPESGSVPLDWAHSGPIPLGRTGLINPNGRSGLTGSMPLNLTSTLTGGLTLGRRGRGRKKRQTVSGFDPVIRGRGLARLSRRPQPTTASELQRACVRWAVTLWLMVILLQRFQLPNQEIALLLPLVLVWCVYGLVRGVLELDRHRFGWWLAAAGVSAVMVPLQAALTPWPLISQTSWGLLLVTWVVFVFRLRDRRRETYLKVLGGVLKISMWQATVVILFLALQLVVPYQDLLAMVIPKSLLLQNYTLAYQFSYGGAFYRSNGWLGLETSFVSIQLAFGVICALLLRKKLTVLLYLLAAIACTGAQSGVQMIGVAVAVIVFSQSRWALARYSVMIPAIIAFLISPLGSNTVNRLSEGTGSNTSTGQRLTLAYELLWPIWTKEPFWVLLGRGPGSSQSMIETQAPVGTTDPTPVKLFFEYGVIAGLALAAFLLFMYLGGPSRAMGIAMVTAYWIPQPSATQILLIVTVPMFITWWTPRSYPMLESEHVPSPNAAIAAPASRRPWASAGRPVSGGASSSHNKPRVEARS